MDPYQLAIKLSLDASGMMAGAAMVMSRFSGIKAAAEAADTSVLSHQRTLDRMNFMGASQQSKTYQYALQQQGQAATEAAVAHDKLARAQRGANMIGAGVASFGVGMAGVGVLKGWITDAGALELAMNNVRLATGATSAQLDAMQRSDIKIALSNQMDITSVEALRAKAASSGLNDMTKLNALMPELSRFAEVMRATKNYTAEESATTGVQFAHIFQGYKPEQIKPLLDQFARALQTSSATPNEFIHTLSGFAGVAKTMYGSGPGQAQKSSSDAIAMTSLLDNLGQGGRGGTQLRALLLNSMDMLSARGAIHNKALNYLEKEAHGSFFDKSGQFIGMANMMDVLMRANAAINNPKNSATIDRAALTAGGAALAGMLGDPAVVDRFKAIRTEVSGKGSLFSLDASQQFVNQTQVGRFNQLQANMDTISALMGQKLMPAVVAVATAFTQLTAGIIDFADQHPLITQIVADTALVATALALIAAPILLVSGALSILGPVALGLGGALGTVAGVLAGIGLGPLLLIGAAIVGTVLVITHWGETVKILGDLFSGLGTGLHGMIDWMRSHIPGFAGATDALGNALSGHDDPHRPLLNPYTAQGLLVPNSRGAVDTAGAALVAMYTAASRTSGVPLNVLLAQGARESDFHNVAQKGGGGLGLAQWDFSTVANANNAMRYLHATSVAQAKLYAMDPARAIMAQATYDADLRRQHGGTWQGALAAYNGSGPAANKYGAQVWAAAAGIHAGGKGGGSVAPGVHQSVAHGPVTNHYNVTINTTSDQHARDVAREAVRELERRQSEKMRDLHRYGSLTPSGVELGFHGS